MTSLGLLLSNTLNFTLHIFKLIKELFSTPSTLQVQSYGDFLFLTNFFNNFIKI